MFCHPFHRNTCVTLLGCCHTQPKDRSGNEYSVMNAGGNADGKNEAQIKKHWDSSKSVSVLIAFSVDFCYVLYCLTEQKKNRIHVYCVLSCKYLFQTSVIILSSWEGNTLAIELSKKQQLSYISVSEDIPYGKALLNLIRVKWTGLYSNFI